jgi:hypothetical protein
MIVPWHFDAGNPYEDAFEESLLRQTHETLLSDVIGQALERIRQIPFDAGTPTSINGHVVYVFKTAPVTMGNASVHSLLIAYVLEPKAHLIRPVLICHAGDPNVMNDIQAAIENAPAEAPEPERRLLWPVDPTSIPEKTIESAVRRVLKRSKQSA